MQRTGESGHDFFIDHHARLPVTTTLCLTIRTDKALDVTTALPYYQFMFEFIEAPFFTKSLDRYLDDDEYLELQSYLIKHPESGKVVRGSGGVRKLRWGAEGRGKRGGLRVIYYLRLANGHIWMLTIYGKNVIENIPAHVLKSMKEAIDDAKND